jgi:hypothetical protein
MIRWGIWAASWVAMAMAICLFTGCTQTGLTKPARSATEQLLLSTAADRALAQADFSIVRDKKVYVDRTYFDSLDKEYVVGTIRDFVSSNGGLLATNMLEADLILEPRSGALSIDASTSVLGIPASTAPVPFTGAVQLPELALFKTEKQYSIAKIALLAYDRDSRKHIASSGPLVGRANIKYYTFLGYVHFTQTTVPEKKRQKKSHPPHTTRAGTGKQP